MLSESIFASFKGSRLTARKKRYSSDWAPGSFGPRSSRRHAAKGEDEEPEILNAGTSRPVIRVACPEKKPLYAIAAFAGVRWCEIEKLEWGTHIRGDEIIVIAGTDEDRFSVGS